MFPKKLKIGIIGVGFVGGAVKKYFEIVKKLTPFLYDKYKGLGSGEEINHADVVFICVPTPYKPKTGFDLSAVKDAIKVLKSSKILVIKSSVIPGSTQMLQKQFAKHKILFNPEFLREVSAYEDMTKPDRQILGVTKQSKSVSKTVMKLLPKAPYEKIMPSAEAEAVKYMANAFLALKVVFANEFYEICQALGLNYQTIKAAVVKDSRIGDSHFNVSYGGYRGYGGSCFPKDVNAIIELASKRKVKTELLTAMREKNRKYLKNSGLSEHYFLTEKHKKNKL